MLVVHPGATADRGGTLSRQGCESYHRPAADQLRAHVFRGADPHGVHVGVGLVGRGRGRVHGCAGSPRPDETRATSSSPPRANARHASVLKQVLAPMHARHMHTDGQAGAHFRIRAWSQQAYRARQSRQKPHPDGATNQSMQSRNAQTLRRPRPSGSQSRATTHPTGSAPLPHAPARPHSRLSRAPGLPHLPVLCEAEIAQLQPRRFVVVQ
jgi:hypothetical protein